MIVQYININNNTLIIFKTIHKLKIATSKNYIIKFKLINYVLIISYNIYRKKNSGSIFILIFICFEEV